MVAIKSVFVLVFLSQFSFVPQLSFAAGSETRHDTPGGSAMDPKMFFVVESHSLTGYEQASIERTQSGQWTLVQNSNFLTNSLPARLGIFKGPLSPSLEEKLSKLVKNLSAGSALKNKKASHVSPHDLILWINGKKMDMSLPEHSMTIALLTEASSLPSWEKEDGLVVADGADLYPLDCLFQGLRHQVCTTKYGWIHRYN